MRPEDLDSDDEPTEEEKFLHNLHNVQSKIASIWRGNPFNRRVLAKEVRVKNLDSGPTPLEDDNDQFSRQLSSPKLRRYTTMNA